MAQGNYDHPMYVKRDLIRIPNVGGAATTAYGKTVPVNRPGRVRKWNAIVITAGTATTHAVNLYVGTTSIGSISLGTSAANTIVEGSDVNTTVPESSLGWIEVRSGADAAGIAGVTIEYELTPDADWS